MGLMAAASTTDPAIQKKIYGSHIITLIIVNGEIKDIMKKIPLKFWIIRKWGQ